MWEAAAEYEDGTSIRKYFEYNERKNEDKQIQELEGWLIEYHEGCTWYSVNYVDEDYVNEYA